MEFMRKAPRKEMGGFRRPGYLESDWRGRRCLFPRKKIEYNGETRAGPAAVLDLLHLPDF
jgi:hypothetical protein